MKLSYRTQQVHLRTAENTDGRTLEGLAVPFDTRTQIIPGFTEEIARGAIDLDARPALFYRHDEPIGVVTHMREGEAGLEIVARISDTALGRDAATLAKDGAITSLSIGFFEREYEDHDMEDGGICRIQKSIDLREISLVPIPAYEDATITNIRSRKEEPMTEPNARAEAFDASQIQRAMEEGISVATENLERRLALLETATRPEAAPADTRSAAEFLKALAAGEEATARAAEVINTRAWSGTPMSADATMTTPVWVKDLTRLYDRVNPLKALFSTGALPAEGMSIEFSELATNTVAVGIQSAEGADLAAGKVTTSERTAPVKTFGGYVSLSRQAIERTRLPILANHLNAMSLAAGNMSATYFAGIFNETVKEQAASALTVAKDASALTWADLAALVVDAVDKYADLGVPMDGLIVDKATFKALASLTGADGRPLMHVSGTGANTAGEMHLTSLSGDLVGIKVTPHMKAAAGSMGDKVVGAFYSSLALRTYETGLVQLQDENIVNLTRDFSIYRYGAVAPEIPGGLVPLKVGA